ncbi:MAG: hypothetical protein PHF86_04745 [Candidatus Nanoarchaeia archaeon]|jgi:hypothetical protein|nr:hypothetical protein [Candidatus Nanoarchaeia archaeon]
MAIHNKITVKRTNVKPMVFELEINDPPPPLTLLINPSTLENKSVSKILEQRVRWTGGNIPYIFQVHHDELDVLISSGKSAMFFSNEKGLTRIERIKTAGYENIEKLIAIYRNNGTNRNTKPNGSINPCTIETIGRVILSYNEFIYRGHFTSFSVSENESMPFNIDFNFEYKVTQTFDINRVNVESVLRGSTF